MLFDVFSVVLGSQTSLRTGVKKTEDQMLGPQRKELRELNHSFQNLFVDISGLVVVVERRISSQQLVNQDSDSPIVYSLTITCFVCFIKHFRGQVLWSSTNSESAQMVQFFCKPQINQFGESLSVNHDILRFEISEDDILSMQVADCIKNSSYIKHGCVVIEPAIASQPSKKFTTLNVLKHHINVFGVLEGRFPEQSYSYSATIFGWLTSSRTYFSECRCISWFCSSIYCLRMIFRAKTSSLPLNFTNFTLPNVPQPSVVNTSRQFRSSSRIICQLSYQNASSLFFFIITNNNYFITQHHISIFQKKQLKFQTRQN